MLGLVIRCMALIFTLLLAGCGQVADLIEYADSASEAQDLNAQVAGLDPTSFVAMPEAGSVIYTGHAAVVYDQGGQQIALLGQAAVTANFTDQLLSGRIDQVFGGTGAADVQHFTGALTFDGQIGVRRPNSFDAVLTGQLSGHGQTVALSGPLWGDFRGNAAQALTAVTHGPGLATVNGAEVPVRVRVTAEQ